MYQEGTAEKQPLRGCCFTGQYLWEQQQNHAWGGYGIKQGVNNFGVYEFQANNQAHQCINSEYTYNIHATVWWRPLFIMDKSLFWAL